MKRPLRGRIAEGAPRIRFHVTRSGLLRLGSGRQFKVVDTGFDGDISAPLSVLKKLDMAYSGTMPFQFADGSVVVKDLHLGQVQLGNGKFDAVFILGDALLGMELAKKLFRYIHVDLDRDIVELGTRRLVKPRRPLRLA